MRFRTVSYGILTTLVVLELIVGGIGDVLHLQVLAEGIRRIGYPVYFLTILGTWKILGGLALTWPGLPRLKEWAYAGVFFLTTGAAISHAVCGEWGHVIAPASIAVLRIVSWALRPQSRMLGVPFQTKTREAIDRNIAAASL
jgi:uncharacterized membrane protein YphA (DoxX/SURF4 family)